MMTGEAEATNKHRNGLLVEWRIDGTATVFMQKCSATVTRMPMSHPCSSTRFQISVVSVRIICSDDSRRSVRQIAETKIGQVCLTLCLPSILLLLRLQNELTGTTTRRRDGQLQVEEVVGSRVPTAGGAVTLRAPWNCNFSRTQVYTGAPRITLRWLLMVDRRQRQLAVHLFRLHITSSIRAINGEHRIRAEDLTRVLKSRGEQTLSFWSDTGR
ncbi:hypothetical protein MUK42_04366 [Musa troglodytarum]|uniref:Uncharacterized protein n=1 Tax=Musa troglodytarum TaxID=320322 RepID=A0A9E7HVF4_9LILI|nr:hypothetical protein MUK42_04366 [Musa troglodytarum]